MSLGFSVQAWCPGSCLCVYSGTLRLRRVHLYKCLDVGVRASGGLCHAHVVMSLEQKLNNFKVDKGNYFARCQMCWCVRLCVSVFLGWRQVSPLSTCTRSKSIINKWLIMHDFGAFARYQHAPPPPPQPSIQSTCVSCPTFVVFHKLFVAFDSLTFWPCDSAGFSI